MIKYQIPPIWIQFEYLMYVCIPVDFFALNRQIYIYIDQKQKLWSGGRGVQTQTLAQTDETKASACK